MVFNGYVVLKLEAIGFISVTLKPRPSVNPSPKVTLFSIFVFFFFCAALKVPA